MLSSEKINEILTSLIKEEAKLDIEQMESIRKAQKTGLWLILTTEYDPFSAFTHFLQILPIQSLRVVNASGVDVIISRCDLAYIWMYLLPLCLWIKNLWIQLGKRRVLIGIVGSPGAGKSVLR